MQEVMENDDDRNEIRQELSKMSFEELQKLKRKLGSKVYDEAMFGSKKCVAQDFKRKNKNRPREVSSKQAQYKEVKTVQKDIRDPRFDSLCGEYDAAAFKKNYHFIDKIRDHEIATLKEQVRCEENPEERRNIKSLLQRLKNKKLEESKLSRKLKKQMQDREEKLLLLKNGVKPHFPSKLETKVAGLVDKFSELKQSGKLQKHIEKQRKKVRQKERKTGIVENSTRPWE